MATPFKSRLYREQNQRYGVPVRWWKAFPCECIDPVTGQSDVNCPLCERDGRRYIEQSLPNGLDGRPARVLVYESREAIAGTDFGPLPTGTLMMSSFPDLMPVARLDRVALLDRGKMRRQVITRGAGTESDSDFDALDFTPVRDIISITQGAVLIAAANYQMTDDGVRWTGATRPAAGTRYTVDYASYLIHVCEHRVKDYGTGADGQPLQNEWALSLKPMENQPNYE